MSDHDAVGHAINVSQIRRAQTDLADALARFEEAQAKLREALKAERAAKDALDGAELDADWLLVAPDTNPAGGKLLADDKKAWKKREQRNDPAVAKAADVLRQAEHNTAVARDALTLADKRLGACRADLDAARTTLEALCLAIPARKGGSE